MGLHGGNGDTTSDTVMLLVGGTELYPTATDVTPLRETGVDGVFPVGSFTEDMVVLIREGLTGEVGHSGE